MALWVGIDGGGTRTRAVVIDARDEIVARVEGGPGLVDAAAPLARATALAALVRRAVSAAGAEATVPRGVCCGLAGAGRMDVRNALTGELTRLRIAESVSVLSDAEAARFDAFRGGAGVLLISGTGSAAWATAPSGESIRAGGWGTMLGDEGSGYAIGLAALRAVVRSADGRESHTELSATVLEATGVQTPEGLIPWAAEARKADIAALAPMVLEAAAAGDARALLIEEEAAAELAIQVAAVVSRSGPWPDEVPIALDGGLVSPGGPLRAAVVRALGHVTAHTFRVSPERVDAARGAALLARTAASGA